MVYLIGRYYPLRVKHCHVKSNKLSMKLTAQTDLQMVIDFEKLHR